MNISIVMRMSLIKYQNIVSDVPQYFKFVMKIKSKFYTNLNLRREK